MVISQLRRTDCGTECSPSPSLSSNGGGLRSVCFTLIGCIFKVRTPINFQTPRFLSPFFHPSPRRRDLPLANLKSQTGCFANFLFLNPSELQGSNLSSSIRWRVEEKLWGQGRRRRGLLGAARRGSNSLSVVLLVSSRPASTPSELVPELRSTLPLFLSTSLLR